jgi:hypothetical protein
MVCTHAANRLSTRAIEILSASSSEPTVVSTWT